jgi:hypothetical protein
MIQVKTPDGAVAQFPDGTPPEAIKAAMSKKFGGPDAKAPGPQSLGGLPVIGDAWDSMKEAGGRIKAEYDANAERNRRVMSGQPVGLTEGMLSAPKMLLDAAGAIPAALQAAVVRPTSRAIANVAPMPGKNRAETAATLEGDLNTAMMGLRPAPGRLPQVPKPPPRTAIPRSEAAAGGYVQKLVNTAPQGALAATARPRTAAEAIGKSGEVALGALARRTGETGDALKGVVADRQITRPSRMLDDVAAAAGVHPDAASGNIQAVVDAGRAKAAPLYDEAYAAGPITSPQLDLLVSRPSMRTAMARAARIAAEEGRDPTELGFKTVKRGAGSTARDTATFDFPEGSGGRFQVTGSKTVHDPQMADVQVQLESPTAQTWDYVKRGIDDVLNGYRDSTTGKLNLDEEGRAILGTQKQMRNELINANPVYGKALEAAGDYMSADQAFKDGGKLLFNGNFTEKQWADKLAAMPESTRDAFRGGIANHFYNLAQNGKLDPKLLKTPRVRAKLEAALGPDGSSRLIAAAEEEAAMLAFERRHTPGNGSPTQEYKAAMDEQDGAPGAIEAAVGSVADRGVRGTLAKGVSEGIKGLVARTRTGGLNEAARNEAGRLLMMSPDELEAYLAAAAKTREANKFKMPAGVGRIGASGLPPLARKPVPQKR